MTTNQDKVGGVPWRGLSLAFLLIALVAALGFWRPWSTQDSPAVPSATGLRPARAPAPPAVRQSRFLNAGVDVRYIGVATCRECHPAEYESYLRTAHSQALGEVDPASAPPDARFVHAASGRSYEVLRQGGKLIHRESLPGPDGNDPIVAEHAVRYAMGSGHHARSYLIDLDDFLIVSPLTWYESKNEWAMSPGYDQANHLGFERVAPVDCVYCHAGRIESHQGGRYRLSILEASIGCERCHGPGGLHADKHAGHAAGGSSVADDFTIVHPARLSRDEIESVCSQCHHRGGAVPSVRGQRLLDFRPGLRMADFQVDFEPEHPSSQMKVVGHMEQMRASACYRGSEMTCTSCHAPHGSPRPEERVAYYRDRCNACHSSGCKQDAALRLAKVADDNCIACHMPQKPTELDHVAFTHHRVGFHEEGNTDVADETELITLRPRSDLAPFSAADRDRLYGLAYLEFAQLHGRLQDRPAYRRRAMRHLQAAQDGGAVDAAVEMGLAETAWSNQSLGEAAMAARRCLTHSNLESGAHASAWMILAESSLRIGEPVQAQEALEQLIEICREPENWVLLAQARLQTGDPQGALAALLQANEASPFRPDIHEYLAQLYQGLGQTTESDRHRRLASYLRQQATQRE